MNDNQRRPVSSAASVQTLHPVIEDAKAPRGDGEFSTLLKQLSEGIRKEDVKQREGWRDRNGNSHFVDYVEWHRVADLLDELAPTWSHSVRIIVQIGEYVAAIAAITINGITREGVGTGSADSETGIKKAEHDALKRAAVKFGVARELYRDEEKGSDSSDRQNGEGSQSQRVSNPIAKTLDQLVTAKQISLIKQLAEKARLNPEEICQEMYKAELREISRRAASVLIDHLRSFQPR